VTVWIRQKRAAIDAAERAYVAVTTLRPATPPRWAVAAMERMGTMGPPRNNYVLVVLDSCRYDSFQRARPKTIRKLGPVQKRWSYASWTAPSHFNLLMGLMPHVSPKHVFASEYYKKDFTRFNERLGRTDIQFKSLVPQLYLPPFLRDSLGYATHARVFP
jgi:hypothetical protein